MEVGTGYGRIIKELEPFASKLVGIDISKDSVELGRNYIKGSPRCSIEVMDAYNLKFGEEFGNNYIIKEVDESSLFLIIKKPID